MKKLVYFVVILLFDLLEVSEGMQKDISAEEKGGTAKMAFYEERYTPDQKALADEIISLEKDALDKFFKGDMSGYLNLWSKDNFTYFDVNCKERIDHHEQIAEFLMTKVQGKMFADTYDFRMPRVQFSKANDMAVLTYQLFADSTMLDMSYNVIEVYQKVKRAWEVIHSTWDVVTAFSPDIKRPKGATKI